MNYKTKDIINNTNHIFSAQSSDSDECEQCDSNEFNDIDPSILENIFHSIQEACEMADEASLLNFLDQLTQIYSNGKINSSDIATKYDFITVCSEILTMCGNIEIVGNLLNCLCYAIQSDLGILDLLSNPTFSEQLVNCIDEKGSPIHNVGFEILSKAIQGYSKPLFSKLCYIFATTQFQNEDLTQTDIENLNYFGKVFSQISKFPTEKSYLIMFIIAKIFILYGLFNFGVEIITNVLKVFNEGKIQIFVLNKLTEQQFSEIGKNNTTFYSEFTITNDLTNSFDSIQPSIFIILLKSIPFHKERSEFFCFDFETSLINTLKLLIDLLDDWGRFSRASTNNINYGYLLELMDFNENEDIEINYTIQSYALSLIAEIFHKDKNWHVLAEETECSLLSAIKDFAEKMDDMPLKIRTSSLKCICKIIDSLYSDKLDVESKRHAFENICISGIVEKIIDFFVSDSQNRIYSAYALWVLIGCSEEAKKQCLDFADVLEEIENETDDREMKAQLYLINLSLRKLDDFEQY